MGQPGAPVLAVEGLSTAFRTRGATVYAVNDVSFALAPGELLGVVGESGSGMSEMMGNIQGIYNAKPKGFVPGGMSLHSMMLPHGPDRDAFEHASSEPMVPLRQTGTVQFMFETRFPQHLTEWAATSMPMQPDYADCWKSLEKTFDGASGVK